MVLGLEINIDEIDQRIILRLNGRLDAPSSAILEDRLNTLLKEKHKNVFLDFSDMDYLSSVWGRLLAFVLPSTTERRLARITNRATKTLGVFDRAATKLDDVAQEYAVVSDELTKEISEAEDGLVTKRTALDMTVSRIVSANAAAAKIREVFSFSTDLLGTPKK